MEKVYVRFAEALDEIVGSSEGSWQDRAAALRLALEEQGSWRNFEEILNWFASEEVA